MISVLVQNWWAFAARGVIAILLGLVAFALPSVTLLSLVYLFAVYAVLGGVLAIVGAVRSVRSGEHWALLALEGIVGLIAGFAAIAMPGLTLAVFIALLAAWALLSGALMLAAAFRVGAHEGRWWLVLGGLAALLYGVALVIEPVAGALVLAWWIGAYAIVFGISLMIFAFRLRGLRGSSGPRSSR
jgi:uncharacterized membrane protein HdeD (DUF308 family)